MLPKSLCKSVLAALVLLLSSMLCSLYAQGLQSPVLQVSELTLLPEAYTGVCPVDIQAKAQLMASEGGSVQYRWVYKGAMGEVAIVRVRRNEPALVTTIFKDIGKTHQPDTLILSSNPSDKTGQSHSDVSKVGPVLVHTATVQLLILPLNEQDWHKARKSKEIRFKVECATKTTSDVITEPPEKADLVLGPTITVAGATVPWGGSLVVDAKPFQSGRRGTQCALPIAYDVLNRGRAAAAASQATLMVGAQTLSLQAIEALTSASKVTITDTIYLSEGRYILGVKVDHQEQVAESSESNNVQRVTLQILGCRGL